MGTGLRSRIHKGDVKGFGGVNGALYIQWGYDHDLMNGRLRSVAIMEVERLLKADEARPPTRVCSAE